MNTKPPPLFGDPELDKFTSPWFPSGNMRWGFNRFVSEPGPWIQFSQGPPPAGRTMSFHADEIQSVHVTRDPHCMGSFDVALLLRFQGEPFKLSLETDRDEAEEIAAMFRAEVTMRRTRP